jgi:hypothetical protein
MACEDTRQLTEAQRQAGYQQGRTGVVRAVRPFSGKPTLENLLDYINRELYPAVKSTRDRVNDVYLPTVDNAPSANPLIYYFSTETGAADPTAGRIRLDASPQDTATTMRVSETNARLVDARPWLEVMAGGATTPLGVVTLSDAINPARFIRFDLGTMTDQGTYWDLGVTVIESSHDDPFVDGGGLVVSFIPGVASTGTTVPPGALTPIGPNTVLGNPTTSTAAPTEIAMAENSVLGRAGAAGTGNIEAITVPGTGTLTGEVVYLQSSSLRNHVRWSIIGLNSLPLMGDNTFVGNISGATARPAYTGLGDLSSDTIIYENVGKTFVRQTMDGDVFADQNSNVTLIQPNVVSDTKLRDSGALSVIGRAFNSTGDPADISATAASDAVLRESGSVLGFGTIATGGLADDSVTNAKLAEMAANTVKANATSATANPTDFAVGTNTVLGRVGGDIVAAQLVNAQITDATIANAKLANMAAGTFKGRVVTGSTGAPQDLTGAEAGGGLRYAVILDTTSTGTVTSYAPTGLDAATATIRITPAGALTLRGMVLADGQQIVIRVGRSAATTVTLNHEDSSASADAERFNCPGNAALVLRAGEACLIRRNESRNNVIAVGRTSVADADYGDITVSSSGTVWTIDANVVSDTKLRDSAAVSVIGRSANSSGDPADIAAAANDRLLARTGDSLAFQQLTVGMVADGILTNAKLANMAAGTVKGRQIDAVTGVPVDLTAAELGEIAAYATIVNTAGLSGTVNVAINTDTSYLLINTTADITLASVTSRHEGAAVFVEHLGPHVLTVPHNSGSATLLPISTPNGLSVTVPQRSHFWLVRRGGFWRFAYPGTFASTTAGLAPPSGGGTTNFLRADGTWTTVGTTNIADDAITNAKLRNSSALSVIGRSVNSSGDPADIATTSGSNGVLVESGGVLAWGLVTTNNILDNTIANADLRQSAALSVVGRTNNTLGNVADISAVAASDAVLRESGSTLSFGQIATAGIANDAVTDGKLRNGVALSVIGRSANSTGDVADIAAANDGEVLRRSGTTLGFGTVATVGIADAAVTLAKQADLAQSRIIGRAEGAGTGVPTALTPTQVVAIIDGEAITWTGTHAFNGTNLTANTASDITLTSGGTTTLAATTQVQITSPTRLASSIAFDSIGTTGVTAANNLVINSVNVVRFTGPPNPLTGMVPAVSGQTVLLVNTHATDDMVIQLDSPSSSAANRFAGEVTDRHIKPGEMALAWYDGTSTVWRLLCRDDVDL